MTDDRTPTPGDVYLDVEQLAFQLGRQDLVIYDASIARIAQPDGSARYLNGTDVYRAGHIPTALHADLVEHFSDKASNLPFMRTTLPELERLLASYGVSDDTTVVIYNTLNGVWAARLWWVLKSAGLRRVHLLAGGFAAWMAAHGAVETGAAASRPARGRLTLVPQAGWFTDLDAVQDLVATDRAATLLCALRPEDYRARHIPGSRLLAYRSILDADGVANPALAAEAARTLALQRDDPVVLYCGGGVNAAGVGAALRQAGYWNVAVYDGSLAEWTADPSRPLASGAPR